MPHLVRFCEAYTRCETDAAALFGSGRSVTEFVALRSITRGERTVTKDIVSDLIPATGWLILKFQYTQYPFHSSRLTVHKV